MPKLPSQVSKSSKSVRKYKSREPLIDKKHEEKFEHTQVFIQRINKALHETPVTSLRCTSHTLLTSFLKCWQSEYKHIDSCLIDKVVSILCED